MNVIRVRRKRNSGYLHTVQLVTTHRRANELFTKTIMNNRYECCTARTRHSGFMWGIRVDRWALSLPILYIKSFIRLLLSVRTPNGHYWWEMWRAIRCLQFQSLCMLTATQALLYCASIHIQQKSSQAWTQTWIDSRWTLFAHPILPRVW